MVLWSKGVDRSKTGEIHKEDDLKNMIDEFFSNQEEKVPYEIVDDQNWIVDIDGNLHLNQSDLDEGKLFFKIGKLSGNLYFHGKHMSPSVIPDQMDGDIIFVPEEEELARTRVQKGNNEDDELDMGLLTNKKTPKKDIVSNLKSAFAETLSSEYQDQIDILEILDEVKKDWEAQNKYNLIIDFPENKSVYGNRFEIQCDIYVHEDDFNVPKEKRKPLQLNAIQKAYYLMFILKKDGLILDDIKMDDCQLAKKIYTQLPKRVEKTHTKDKKTGKETEYNQGISKDNFQVSSIRGYVSEIRTAIHKRIPYINIANDFAIEGYKGQPFGVARATDEMRVQIREKFGLD